MQPGHNILFPDSYSQYRKREQLAQNPAFFSMGLTVMGSSVAIMIWMVNMDGRSSLGENRLETSYAAGLSWEREKALNNFPLTDTSIKLQSAPVGAMPGV